MDLSNSLSLLYYNKHEQINAVKHVNERAENNNNNKNILSAHVVVVVVLLLLWGCCVVVVFLGGRHFDLNLKRLPQVQRPVLPVT